jgi:hypothetical protein
LSRGGFNLSAPYDVPKLTDLPDSEQRLLSPRPWTEVALHEIAGDLFQSSLIYRRRAKSERVFSNPLLRYR